MSKLFVSLILAAGLALAGCSPQGASPQVAPTSPAMTAEPTSSSPEPTISPSPTVLAPISTATSTAEPHPFAIRADSLAWSPNSRWLAFVSLNGENGPVEINLLRKGENSPKTLAPRPWPATTGDLRFAWSLGGEDLLVYGNWGKITGAWLVAVSEAGFGAVETLVIPQQTAGLDGQDAVITNMAWSADGHSIAYTLYGEAWVYDLDTRRTTQVTHITRHPLARPDASEPPFDGVRAVSFSRDGKSLGLELSCGCPNPWSGVGVVDLTHGEARLLVDGADLAGWSPDGSAITVRNIPWGGGLDDTSDFYRLDPASGRLTNLTRSNPAFDPLVDGYHHFKPGTYQTYEFAWNAQGQYLYRTRDYHNMADGVGPVLGLIARDATGRIMVDRQPAGDRWSVFPAWLADGRLAWIDAAPGYPNPRSEYTFQVWAAVIDGMPVLKQDLLVEWPAWAPDGSALAYLARSNGADGPMDTVRWLIIKTP